MLLFYYLKEFIHIFEQKTYIYKEKYYKITFKKNSKIKSNKTKTQNVLTPNPSEN